MTYMDAVKLGREAFYNGHPKVFPRPEQDATPYFIAGWHNGWVDAWKQDTQGQIALGVYK